MNQTLEVERTATLDVLVRLLPGQPREGADYIVSVVEAADGGTGRVVGRTVQLLEFASGGSAQSYDGMYECRPTGAVERALAG
jgi:hypothetical protein